MWRVTDGDGDGDGDGHSICLRTLIHQMVSVSGKDADSSESSLSADTVPFPRCGG